MKMRVTKFSVWIREPANGPEITAASLQTVLDRIWEFAYAPTRVVDVECEGGYDEEKEE